MILVGLLVMVGAPVLVAVVVVLRRLRGGVHGLPRDRGGL